MKPRPSRGGSRASHRLYRAPLIVGLLMLGLAHAQTAPEAALAPSPAAEADTAMSAEALAAWREAQQALARQDWVQAELWLERTLMLMPEHAESLVQLALVLLQRGRTETAQALIAALEADPRTPPQQRVRLAQLREAAGGHPPAMSDRADRTTVQIGLGRSSNPLAVTSAREIRLTLPGGDLVASLNQRPQPANLATAEVIHQTASGAQWALQLRRSDLSGTAGAWRLGALLPLGDGDGTTPAAAGPWALQIGAQRGLDASAGANVQLIHRCANTADTGGAWLCGVGLFGENTGRRGLLLRVLRSQTTHGAAHAPQPLAMQAWAEAEIVRGSAQPDVLRLGAQLSWQPAPAWRVLGALQAQTDTAGYSPLLGGGAPRRLLTGQLALQWRLPVQPASGQWTLQLATARRHANLPLFAWREHNLQLLWQHTLSASR